MFDDLFKVLTEEEKKEKRLENLKSIEKSIEEEKFNLIQFSNWHSPVSSVLEKDSKLIKVIPSFIIPASPLLVLNSYNFNEFTEDEKNNFNESILSLLPDYYHCKKLFLRNGTFSNKFNFSVPNMGLSRDFVEVFSHISHMGLTMGAGIPSEIVIREFIEDVEESPVIYNGMPLRTEFRFFYDFDCNEILGSSNYWNREIMVDNFLNTILNRSPKVSILKTKDSSVLLECLDEIILDENIVLSSYQNVSYENLKTFLRVVDKIESEYNEFKYILKEDLDTSLTGCILNGKWSIDIMKNGSEFYFIDMAPMERSSLTEVMDLF